MDGFVSQVGVVNPISLLFMVDISNYLLWFISQQTSLGGAPHTYGGALRVC